MHSVSQVAPTPISDVTRASHSSRLPATVLPLSAEFDLHGMVGIRLINATPRDHAAVARQLGPIEAPLSRDPDVVIRFVDRLVTRSPLRLLGVGDAAFADDAFFILRSKHKAPTKVQIAFDTLGSGCEIVCEHGLPAVPLLIPIINLIALARGALALHASAFRYRNTTALVTGWCKGGKTELLLAFIERGAEYVGDEWIYISEDGNRMFGIPEPIRVWDWHLLQLPRYRGHVGTSARVKLASLRHAHRLLGAAAEGSLARRFKALRRLRPVADLIGRQRYAFLRPESAFGQSLGALSGSIDQVIFVGSTADSGTLLAPASSEWIADRMAFSLQEERSVLEAYYRRFRFAFPERASPLIEEAAELERARLRRMLEGKPCHALYHPYPPRISELFSAAAPLFPA